MVRRVGKTTLLKDFLSRTELKYKLDSGDNIRTQEIFNSQSFNEILPYAEGYNLIAIDEAQQIKNIGTGLKILVDNAPGLVLLQQGHHHLNFHSKSVNHLQGEREPLLFFLFHSRNFCQFIISMN